ncbi:hypothetical protein NC653_025474 [Populus alba x Populus x berolinensis]|uniref:Uncharacterized protein n=1 Tax=Populus alba x Populus x berolinensis TaxID=444605 RepID=A0AAD6Q817_9ROSI|nr:hypothetical protein NC653_025474 [Populus alba x Populus x berolinensis]
MLAIDLRTRIIESAILISESAKFKPTQLRGPRPNGRKAVALFFVASATPPANLSGLKRNL